MSRITINSNLASLNAQRRLSVTTNELRSTFEKLSSGLRITRAGDDAAGLSVSELLNVDQRVYAQGVRNLNDGVSALSIAGAALGELSNIVIRIRELATQSANGVLGPKQRQALDEEAQALSKEFTRIVQSTEFNGIGLLDGETQEFRFQGGYGTEQTIVSGLGGAMGEGTFAENQTLVTESIYSSDLAVGDLNGDGLLDMVTAGAMYDGGGQATVFLGQGDGTFSGLQTLATEGDRSCAVSLGDLNGDGTFLKVQTFKSEDTETYALATGDLNGDGVLDIITAGYDGDGGKSTIFLSNTKNGTSPILPFDLTSLAGAKQSMAVLDRKLSSLSTQQGIIGAFEAQLQVELGNLDSARENYISARSRITDADVAEEAAKLARLQILQAASVSVLGQANLQPEIAIQLINGVS